MYTSPALAADPTQQVPQKKIGKINGSYLLMKQCFKFLRQDKELLLFPILSAIALCALAAVAFGGGMFLYGGNIATVKSVATEDTTGMYLRYALLFIDYVIAVFIATFFQAGLTAIVYGRLKGKDLRFMDGMRVAATHTQKILLWAIISATVGLVLRIISERSRLVGKIVVSVLGATWSIITLFIVPALILEEGSVTDAIKKSGETFKKAWGETLVMNFSVGLIMSVLSLGVIVLTIVFLVSQTNLSIILGTVFLLALFVIGVSVLATTFQSIFRVVLYYYAATGTVPDSFDPALVQGAIRQKKLS